MQMNGSWQSASEWVQCAPPNVSTMIEGSARGRRLKIPSRGDTTMLKTISAAFLAASVIAAPAIAAEAGKSTTQAPVIKTDQTQTKASTTAVKPDVKADTKSDAKAKTMNANAAVTPSEHRKHVRSHRHHHKMVAAKTSAVKTPAATTQPSVGAKPTEPVTTGKAKSSY
jgi:hypothetical protein